MSFQETLMRFFRTNFHDEIQRLPVEGISGLDEEILRGPALPRPSQDGASAGEWSGTAPAQVNAGISPMTNGTHTATTVVGQPSFFLPPLAFGQVPGHGPNPAAASTPGSQNRHMSELGNGNYRAPTANGQTPLQRNLARLTRYGMSSITSGPGDRTAQTERTMIGSEGETSPQGSFVNLGTASINPPSLTSPGTIRDIASTISAAKSRMSRMGSLSHWRRG